MSGSDANPGSQSEDSSFPIPRLKAIPNPRPPILPEYQPDTTEFNFEMFQLFDSLVIFHLPAYDLEHIQPAAARTTLLRFPSRAIRLRKHLSWRNRRR